MTDIDELTEKIRQALSAGEALQCTRVWEAWQYGTMTDEDFTDASDGPLAEEIAASVLSIVEDAERQAKAEGWDEGWEHRDTPDEYARDGEQDVPLVSSRYDNPYRDTETGDNDE